MSSAYYALVLGNRPFSNLLFYQTLLFRLYLRKYVNNLVIYHQKSKFVKFKADFFFVILRIFDLEFHGQSPIKTE